MKNNLRLTTLGLAAAATFAAVVPAAADWNNLGTVDFGRRYETAREIDRINGSIDQLRLRADRNGADCRAVTVRFANGQTRNVFNGFLREDRPVTVDLPGDQRNVRNIALTCRSGGRGMTSITVSGDMARDRGPGRDTMVPLGTERFSQRVDREMVFTGLRGENLTAIALMPIDGDARCTRVEARFANGTSRVLDVNRGDVLQNNRMYRIDLPGNQRDVRDLSLTCRALRDQDVTIRIFGERDTARDGRDVDRGRDRDRDGGYRR